VARVHDVAHARIMVPSMTLSARISGDVKVAWFKDPDGNVLSIVNR
jgi:hypothetical protein